ncbi:MAG: hypothetical protein WC797_03415 [Candidatus Paceibacterota bacterium]|jgi:hypothetical protein
MEESPQVEFGRKQKLKKIREIRQESLEEFWNPQGQDDELQLIELTDEEAEKYQREEKEREENRAREFPGAEKLQKIDYEPFDPRKEKYTLRQLTKEEKLLPVGERRKIREAKLQAFKEKLKLQETGLAVIIGWLRKAATEDPDISTEALASMVMAMAPRYKFSKTQLANFHYGIKDYHEKHLAVEKYTKQYPNAEDLFHACFGTRPKGKVVVSKGPMTLNIQCFDIEDYVIAYTFNKHGGDITKITEEDRGLAIISGGAALGTALIPDLGGAVTIANLAVNKKIENYPETETYELKPKDKFVLMLSEQTEVKIEVKGVGTWKILRKPADRIGQGNEPERIKFVKVAKDGTEEIVSEAVVVRDPDSVSADNQGYKYLDILDENSYPTEDLYFDFAEVLRDESYRYSMSVNISQAFISINDYSKDGSTITHQAIHQREVVLNEEYLKRTIVHEEQHQFNKLFKPPESKQFSWDLMFESTRQRTAKKALKHLTKDMVKHWRQRTGIDAAARDEILSYYKDGRGLDDIYKILSKNPLYDYKTKEYYKEQIKKLPDEIKEEVSRSMTDVLWDESEDVTDIDAKKATLDDQLIAKYVGKIFGPIYLLDVESWLKAIKTLEEK